MSVKRSAPRRRRPWLDWREILLAIVTGLLGALVAAPFSRQAATIGLVIGIVAPTVLKQVADRRGWSNRWLGPLAALLGLLHWQKGSLAAWVTSHGGGAGGAAATAGAGASAAPSVVTIVVASTVVVGGVTGVEQVTDTPVSGDRRTTVVASDRDATPAGAASRPAGAPAVALPEPADRPLIPLDGVDRRRVSVVLHEPGDVYFTARLLDGDGKELGSDGAYGWEETGFIEPVALTGPAPHRVRLEPDGADRSVRVERFSVPPDPVGPIAPGQERGVTVAAPGHNPLLDVDGADGRRVSVVVGQGGHLRLTARLIDGNGREVASDGMYEFEESAFLEPTRLTGDGPYRLQVDADGVATGSMPVAVHAVPEDGAGTLEPGQPRTLTVAAPGQNPTLVVPAAPGRRVEVAFSEPDALELTARLLDVDGNELAADGMYACEETSVVAAGLSGPAPHRLEIDPRGQWREGAAHGPAERLIGQRTARGIAPATSVRAPLTPSAVRPPCGARAARRRVPRHVEPPAVAAPWSAAPQRAVDLHTVALPAASEAARGARRVCRRRWRMRLARVNHAAGRARAARRGVHGSGARADPAGWCGRAARPSRHPRGPRGDGRAALRHRRAAGPFAGTTAGRARRLRGPRCTWSATGRRGGGADPGGWRSAWVRAVGERAGCTVGHWGDLVHSGRSSPPRGRRRRRRTAKASAGAFVPPAAPRA